MPVLQEHAPAQSFDLARLLDKSGVLEIALLREDGSRFELLFPTYLAYRKLGEGDAFEALRSAADSTTLGRSFYRVEESGFLDWFIAQRGGVRPNDPLFHFAIMTMNDIIDVICRDAPEVVI